MKKYYSTCDSNIGSAGADGTPGQGLACRRWVGGRWAAGGGRGAAAAVTDPPQVHPAGPAED